MRKSEVWKDKPSQTGPAWALRRIIPSELNWWHCSSPSCHHNLISWARDSCAHAVTDWQAPLFLFRKKMARHIKESYSVIAWTHSPVISTLQAAAPDNLLQTLVGVSLSDWQSRQNKDELKSIKAPDELWTGRVRLKMITQLKKNTVWIPPLSQFGWFNVKAE